MGLRKRLRIRKVVGPSKLIFDKNASRFIGWRFYFVVTIVLIIVLVLCLRLFDLTISNQQFLRLQGDQRFVRQVSTPPFRGMVFDRNGFPLAVSTKVYSLWMNPQVFDITAQANRQLAKSLNITLTALLQRIQSARENHREFIYLQRGLAPEFAKSLQQLALPGLYLQEEYRRYYPEGEITAHVVGMTNVDDQGQEGMELAYNDWLKGEPGKKLVMKDRLGRVIADLQPLKEQKSGQDLRLSIDKRLQYFAYRELLAGIKESAAASGSIVILDVKTGEVLAMVNYPSFNPNHRPLQSTIALRNRAVIDTFEPGSTIKAFSIASALESNQFQPTSMINTAPGWMRVGRNIVKDSRNYGELSLTQILQVSSNMGVAKIILSLPPDQLWSLLHRVGFGEITGLQFPGEQSGSLIKPDTWSPFPLATLSFGYGLSVTALQLARAYAVIANDGMKLPLSLLKVDTQPTGKQVLSTSVAKEVRKLLESVVSKEGTGRAACIPGYRIAGKTGTAKIVGRDGYKKHAYNSNFVGMAPSDHPRVVVAVVLRDLEGKKYSGAQVPAPIFAKVMAETLRILSIPPTD